MERVLLAGELLDRSDAERVAALAAVLRTFGGV